MPMSRNFVNFGVTRTRPERNRKSATAKTEKVARTACGTIEGPNLPSKTELMPPRNAPSATTYAVISAGLGLFLNALTRPRPSPTIAPMIHRPGASCQVAAATTTSSASSPPVLTMTSSYVSRPVSRVVAAGPPYICSSVTASMVGAPAAPACG
jgi:hypothetical protein